jgi:hypothetical protein
MAIQFRRVTWYSKALALALFVALPFIGFYLGAQYGKMEAATGVTAVSAPSSTQATQSLPEYYRNVAEWQTDGRVDGGFSFSYPLDFDVTDDYSHTPTADWRLESSGTFGPLYATLMVPRAFEPQTNFDDAKLTIGASGDAATVRDCLAPPSSGIPATYATTTVNGAVFSVYTFSDAGAGNLYDVTSYRTLHAGKCFAVEYTIHSSQLANYPLEYHLTLFDKAPVKEVLERIVGTFRFLQ